VSWAGDNRSSAEIGTHERNYGGMLCQECYADRVTQETGLRPAYKPHPSRKE
jgi:ribosomal protein L34E